MIIIYQTGKRSSTALTLRQMDNVLIKGAKLYSFALRVILPTKAWEYVLLALVYVSVCLSVCLSVCDHDN